MSKPRMSLLLFVSYQRRAKKAGEPFDPPASQRRVEH
jgi:hypothetical protein